MARRFRFVHQLLRARDYQDRPQLEALCNWWRDDGAGVCALVGMGGAGKTAIVERFLRLLPEVLPEHPDLPKDSSLSTSEALFVFSFYDAPNVDAFFGHLAAWLKDEAYDESAVQPSYQRALALMERAGPCLLILDGLEKVQDDGLRGGAFGRIQDGRLRDFILRAAEGWLPGTSVIITTRFRLCDPIERRAPYYGFIPVEELSSDAAVALLRTRGVTKGTNDQLRAIAKDQGYHALTVDHMGGYIARFCEGDPGRVPPAPVVEFDEETEKAAALDPRMAEVIEQSRKFASVAERYRQGLSESDPAALALLQRACLFRLGVTADTLASIFTGKGKKEISGRHLARLSRKGLQRRLDLLVEARLLEEGERERTGTETQTEGAAAEKETVYSVHPAVRDGFLRSLDAETAYRGHDAARTGLEALLSERPGGENPSHPVTLDLLEEIVYHTLKAGQAQEAWDIYWNRIGGFKNLGWRLGAYERGERICRAFAGGRPPEMVPLPEGLSENRQAVFINEWALYLMRLGRLDASARCFERHNTLRAKQEDLSNASVANQNLAEVFLLAGGVAAGLRAAEEALTLAERADDAQERQNSHSFRAHTRALRGETGPALDDFQAALRDQHEDEGENERPLYSLRGIQHTSLLARIGRDEEAEQLTEANRQILLKHFGDQDDDTPKCNLILADLARERGDVDAARGLVQQAHDWAVARDAKQSLCWSALVRGRIALAEARQQTDWPLGPEASRLLEQARGSVEAGLRIARDCGFGIFHIDLMLERARLHLLRGDPASALADLRFALDDGIHPSLDDGLPELLAATDEECGYAWGIADGRHLRAEALLLQAAQTLRRADFAPANADKLPADVKALIDSARRELNECRDLRARIQDPKVKQTEDLLAKLDKGLLTEYPLTPAESDHESDTPVETVKESSETKETKGPVLVKKCGILFFAANPQGTGQLALDEESREIDQKIRASEHRDALEFITKWAVRPDDLLQCLNQYRPHIVHFSGHGGRREEIILLDRNGNPKPVSKAAMKQLFTTLKDNIRVVVLNACFSRPQAEAIVEVIDCAIGMKKAIGDQAAITFAASFYRAIGFGRSVQQAFDQGKTALMLEGIPEEDTPELLVGTGVDPNALFLCVRDE